MFKISPIQDSTEQISVAKLCGAEYKPSAFAYAMRDADSNDLMGFSQFEITEDGGLLYDLRPAKGYDDFEAMFILGRSTMNFIDLCGTHTLTAANGAADEKLLRAIGFRPRNDGAMFCDMTGFFDGSHCSGNH